MNHHKVAIVTGAGGRIGKSIARMLVDEGYAVIVNDMDPFRCEGTAGALAAGGGIVKAMVGDVSVREEADHIVEMAFGAWGRIDVLVNCAGIFPNTQLIDMEDDEWDRVYNTNLRGPFMLSRAAARAMVAGADGRGRQIINISSTAGESARTGAAHYCGSKAALNMLTKVLAIELAPHGIRVNAVAPGIIVDEVYNTAAPPDDPYVAALLSGIPLGRTGTGNDIANAVRFLVSPEAGWITGEILHVNGGSTAGRVTLPPSQF